MTVLPLVLFRTSSS